MSQDPFLHLIISRKRKKYKFAHFASFANSFTHLMGDDPKTSYKNICTFLGRSSRSDSKLVVELAAGNAWFSLSLAKKYPDIDFIAIDIKSDRLYTSAKQALIDDVKNIAFLRMSIQELEMVFPKQTIDTIWLTFPDPFLRKRSIRRRLTHSQYLARYKRVLKKDGSLEFKTDNRQLFLWSLEQLVVLNWHIQKLSFDLHKSELPEDKKIKTHYEKKFMAQEIAINYLAASPRESSQDY